MFDSLSHPVGRRAVLALGTWALAGGRALAQAWPERPIRMIVPFPPGGGADNAARVYGEKLASVLGQPIVVDNKPGASGNIGAEAVAHAAADGYTLLFGNEFLATNPALFKSLRFDTMRDFAPVARVASSASLIAATPSLPVQTLKDLIALAKTRSLNYASPGVGTGPHLYGQLIALNTGAQFNHVPYKGTAPAISDTVGGQVDFIISTAAPMVPYVQSGKLRALAVTGAQRSSDLPGVPTVMETGVVSDPYEVWYGVVAPAAVPRPVLARLQQASEQVLRDPDVVARLNKAGYDVRAVSPEQFGAEIKRDMERWTHVVQQAKIERQ
ncbi:tripartite tricarboxylate transporter substrate binding protein [Ramlibacter ginsenosidimutans]|uniref:Tripartite tricarboxylate transporter substrate binding protein n=1 Tax=Ramlibacter ginsenosidimutans TaxID=502333 RepID=A0A934TTJ2_9BURK|nr:tripartite tricarboxylate transporter substrate binding protein [Ramlibacter ginsenosidimutans]MBK6007301.1 tripartite tricarboxylate transporter substrate binding protein [Ramlibacter ginsenosidimutans]